MKSSLLLISQFLLCALSVYAGAPAIELSSPTEYQVIQRHDFHFGRVPVEGKLGQAAAGLVSVQARSGGEKWKDVAEIKKGESSFKGEYALAHGGWHELEVRAVLGDQVVGEAVVGKVGVGEIFIIAGQSNSANHGEEKQKVRSGLVSTFDGKTWRIADDPQPGASGRGGSFVPAFADALAQKFEVPIGIIATGVGATSVREWLPKGAKFPNPPTILNKVSKLPDGSWVSKGDVYKNFLARTKSLGRFGFRAVLWHQGESDANQRDASRTLPGELYREYLADLIAATRRDLDWECPWFVAQASYHTPDDTGSPEIRAAQKALWDSGVALEGPDSDKLVGENRDGGGKGVHFSGIGLKAHGAAWAEKVKPWLAAELGRKHVRVFILAGQSNMEGAGGGFHGSRETLQRRQGEFGVVDGAFTEQGSYETPS